MAQENVSSACVDCVLPVGFAMLSDALSCRLSNAMATIKRRNSIAAIPMVPFLLII